MNRRTALQIIASVAAVPMATFAQIADHEAMAHSMVKFWLIGRLQNDYKDVKKIIPGLISDEVMDFLIKIAIKTTWTKPPICKEHAYLMCIYHIKFSRLQDSAIDFKDGLGFYGIKKIHPDAPCLFDLSGALQDKLQDMMFARNQLDNFRSEHKIIL